MSRFPLTAAGAVDAVDNGTVAFIDGGLAFTSAGKLCVTTTNAQFEVHNGFSLDSMGRIRIVAGGTVSEIHNGFALDSQGRLVVTETDPGVAFLHSGRRRGAAGLFLTGVGGGVSGPVLAGLVAWYDASDLVLANGDPVASWPDKSGNGRTLTQGTAAARPSYVASGIGGKPAVRGDGVDDMLSYASGPTPFLTAGWTLITVARPIGAANATSRRLFSAAADTGGDTSQFLIFRSTNENVKLFALNAIRSELTRVAEEAVVGAFTNDLSTLRGHKNGTQASSVAFTTAATVSRLAWFANVSATEYENADLSEGLLYNRALTDAERKQNEAYLGGKYTITVAP